MSDESKALFDATLPFKVRIVRPEGDEIITMRFPSDDQWIERSRRRKIRSRNLGNGKAQSIPEGPDPHDAELVNGLRVGECAEVDPYEAKRILERISMVTFEEDPTREGACLRIPMRVRGVRTVHVLRVPTERQRGEFLQMSGIPAISQGSIETYGFNLGGAKELYDQLNKESVGYAGEVPVVHKLAAVNAAFEAVDKALEGDGENPSKLNTMVRLPSPASALAHPCRLVSIKS